MCYTYGSTDPSSYPCPMCKVFKPSGARCPHVRDVCYNRALHPRLDVVHLKNAEVKSFNGCGYCKWARSNPGKLTGHQNPGWPGCCRPPTSSEQRLVGAADWPTVSIVHNIPMPAEIKTILDNLAARGNALPGIAPSGRSPVSTSVMPSLDRRNSGNSPTTKSSPNSAKSQSMPIPTKGRTGGSPVQQASCLGGTTPRAAGVMSSFVSGNTADHSPPPRRTTYPEGNADKPRTPVRKQGDLEGSVSRRNPGGRPSLASVLPSHSQSSGPRHSSTSSHPRVPDPSPVDMPSDPSFRTGPSSSKLDAAMAALDISTGSESSGSDSGSSHGSMSDATVISDGGFTDYLSDESEAELQRQAEAKAALVAQNQAEELEFKAARQQLAAVGLRPPKSWDDTNESVPRGQGPAVQAAYNHHAAYTGASYAPAPVANQARG
ncbi:hypothetical protein BJ138DRAFT_1140122 [Hygrophoropsis aurantiaca]|uniref:Uncharacterized protein n=1 Tax=Hygrophoropsis aurantiaca TaxID=72124 RepID=A0ACB8ARX2_9AGAM|nr:hypothetical protein BJ138DRAFT_1140122 [Hygrophoropsis aurantiaca]